MDSTTFSPVEQEYNSPKRKREDDVTAVPHLQTSVVPRFSQDRTDFDAGDDSPRARVAGKFQKLNLGPCNSNESIYLHHGRETKRIAQSSKDEPSSSPLQDWSVSKRVDGSFKASTQNTSPASIAVTFGQASHLTPPKEPIKRPKSPSLDGEISDQYWHESEITGHDPDDPIDDGYGLNGIGFKPTPAIAWARSQKRKQQLADYRSREAREARQRRSERRRVGSGESSNTPATVEDMSQTKVRFENG